MSRLSADSLPTFSRSLLALYAPDGGCFSARMLAAFRALFATDVNSYNEFGPTRALILLDPEPLPATLFDSFQAHREDHANLRHLMEVSDESSVKFSDFYTLAQWRRTGLYNEFFAPLGLTHQMAGGFPVGEDGTIVAYALNRERHDFTEDDLTLLNLLRPHLVQAWHHFDAVARAERALRNVAALQCNPAGGILFSTAKAETLLVRYFPSARREQLPDPLRRWLRKAIEQRQEHAIVPVAPFVEERLGARVIARLGAHGGEWVEVTLEERLRPKTPSFYWL